jgi:SpoIIAA-like
MLQRIEAPNGVLAFRAVGKIEKSDYDTVLEPAVEAMIADRGEVRFVYVLGDDFDGYTAGATWEDAKLGLGHASKWTRVAVVTNHDWVRHVVGMFGWMVPGDVKTFPANEEQGAIDWAAG